MKQEHILISSDGPDSNVLKFKPPMVFTERDVDTLITTLDVILSEVEAEMKPITLTLEVRIIQALRNAWIVA